jgi:acid phosphatase (class A)
MKMKKLMILAVMAMANVCAQAQSDVEAYFTSKEMPDMLKWCPAPPDTVGAHFAYDIMQYMWGKQMRQDKERAAIAIRDAEYGLDCIIREFSEPFGMQISKEETPEIYKVLRDATATCDSICTLPKKYYMRRRPFMRMHESTLYPQDEPALRKNGSYPSGHTILGWSSALLLSEINPDRADTILARGYMYGESRVIVGAHWQSDVDAGRMAGTVLYQLIRNHKRFIEQLAKASAEFAEQTGSATRVTEAPRVQQQGSTARVYRLDGTPATESSQGILIQNNQKFVRK